MMPYQRKPIVDDGLGVNPGLLANVETMLEAAHKEGQHGLGLNSFIGYRVPWGKR